MNSLISLLIPVFNESESIATTLARIDVILQPLRGSNNFEILVINDGSTDSTLQLAEACRVENALLVLIDLSRNFGKEAALSAGLATARGSAVIPLDADLQDPPEIIPAMLAKWREGFEVVLARRADRRSDGWLKRTTARQFYKLMANVGDIEIPSDVGDFRLMDRAVVDVLNALPEHRRFMKGLFAWAGFRTCIVEYVRPNRSQGVTKFSPARLINLAIEGITSFSTAPLRLVSYLGLIVAALASTYAAWIVVRTISGGVDIPGYASLLSIILFLSATQLIGLGVIGEYVGRTYMESKRRPPYVIRAVSTVPASGSTVFLSDHDEGSAGGKQSPRQDQGFEPEYPA